MKKLLCAFVLVFWSAAASAVNYSVTATWTDPTVIQPGFTYTPNYEVEHRVNAGTPTAVGGLGTTTWASTITANPGDTIEVRVRTLNIAADPDLASAWSAWANAVTPQPYQMPATPSVPILIVIPQ